MILLYKSHFFISCDLGELWYTCLNTHAVTQAFILTAEGEFLL